MLTEFQKIIIHNRLTNLLHQVEQEVEIMVTCQADTKGFISLEQVAKIGTGVVLTSVAITIWIKWGEISGELGILDNQAALTGHTSTVTSDTSRQDTVKHIDTTNNPINQTVWCSYPH